MGSSCSSVSPLDPVAAATTYVDDRSLPEWDVSDSDGPDPATPRRQISDEWATTPHHHAHEWAYQPVSNSVSWDSSLDSIHTPHSTVRLHTVKCGVVDGRRPPPACGLHAIPEKPSLRHNSVLTFKVPRSRQAPYLVSPHPRRNPSRPPPHRAPRDV
eukprot:EG_transcript_11770